MAGKVVIVVLQLSFDLYNARTLWAPALVRVAALVAAHNTISILRVASPTAVSFALFMPLADWLSMFVVKHLRLLASPGPLCEHSKLSDFLCGAVSASLNGIAIAVHVPSSDFDASPSASGSLTPGVPTPLDVYVNLSALATRSTCRGSAS